MIKESEKVPWEFVADVRCKLAFQSFVLTIDDFTITRSKHTETQFRWKCGHLLGRYHVVKLLTRFNDSNRDEPSQEVIGLMEGAVELLENVLDGLSDAIEEEVERRYQNRMAQSHRLKMSEIQRQLDEELGVDGSREDSQCDIAYLYLFRHKNGLTKLGFSRNPKQREKTIQAEDPRVHMLATRPGKLYQEKRLHRIFADKRVRGEWFDLSDQDVERLMLICGFSASTFS